MKPELWRRCTTWPKSERRSSDCSDPDWGVRRRKKLLSERTLNAPNTRWHWDWVFLSDISVLSHRKSKSWKQYPPLLVNKTCLKETKTHRVSRSWRPNGCLAQGVSVSGSESGLRSWFVAADAKAQTWKIRKTQKLPKKHRKRRNCCCKESFPSLIWIKTSKLTAPAPWSVFFIYHADRLTGLPSFLENLEMIDQF